MRRVHTWDQDTLDYLGSLQMAGGAGWKRDGKVAEKLSYVKG